MLKISHNCYKMCSIYPTLTLTQTHLPVQENPVHYSTNVCAKAQGVHLENTVLLCPYTLFHVEISIPYSCILVKWKPVSIKECFGSLRARCKWNHHNILHGLGHTWSVPSCWRACWSLHLNCGHPLFRFLLGFYVRIFFGIHSIHCTWYFHYDLDFITLAFQLKMFSPSLILAFLICSLIV
jgi:hypothetical protein